MHNRSGGPTFLFHSMKYGILMQLRNDDRMRQVETNRRLIINGSDWQVMKPLTLKQWNELGESKQLFCIKLYAFKNPSSGVIYESGLNLHSICFDDKTASVLKARQNGHNDKEIVDHLEMLKRTAKPKEPIDGVFDVFAKMTQDDFDEMEEEMHEMAAEMEEFYRLNPDLNPHLNIVEVDYSIQKPSPLKINYTYPKE